MKNIEGPKKGTKIKIRRPDRQTFLDKVRQLYAFRHKVIDDYRNGFIKKHC